MSLQSQPDAMDLGSTETVSSPGADRSEPLPLSPRARRRELTYLDGVAIVAGLQIGSGIFSTPAVVAMDVQTALGAVFVWIAAGLLVWTGAASFIELGTRIPTNGGMQQYLRLCLGDTYGFLFAWTWVITIKPVSAAITSTIFAEYFCSIVASRGDAEGPPPILVNVLAVAAIGVITGLNCLGAKSGPRSAQVFLALKVLGIVSIGVVGLIYAVKPHQSPSTRSIDGAPSRSSALRSTDERTLWESFGGAADAMFAALFAYGGWECIGFVAGEIQNPAHTVPRILNHSMILVLALFLVAITTMYAIVPLSSMSSDAIALTFGRLVFGEGGAIFFSVIVCISSLGSLNASILAVGRLTEAASQQRYMPRFLGLPSNPKGYSAVSTGPNEGLSSHRRDTRDLDASQTTQTVPVRAMLANGILGTVYLVTGSFRGLLTFKGIVEYSGYLCTVIGLIRLHHGRLSNPTLTPGEFYHTSRALPFIFCIASSILVLRSGANHPFQVLGIVGFLAAGLVVRKSQWWERLLATGDAK